MGQRMDEPDIVYGYDCTLGEGFDPPLWEHGKTPKYVYARFSNVKKCTKEICVPYPSPPNDRVFKLEQWSVNHCYWIYDSEWWLRWRLHLPYPINSQLTLTKGVVGPHYFDQTFHPNAVPAWCFHNELDCELPGVCGYDGIGIITWGIKARAILKDLNIGLDYKLFMEMRPIENCMQVFKFCRVQDGTNIAIKYDPD